MRASRHQRDYLTRDHRGIQSIKGYAGRHRVRMWLWNKEQRMSVEFLIAQTVRRDTKERRKSPLEVIRVSSAARQNWEPRNELGYDKLFRDAEGPGHCPSQRIYC